MYLRPLLLIIMTPVILGQLQLCPSNSNTNCLPCARQCSTCASSTSCSTCSIEYYLTSSTCTSCPSNCQTCTTSTICSTCLNPYVLVNSTCSRCTILNAISCSSTVVATSCNSNYYLSSGYCYSCLLNCKTCNSASDCSACVSGYYLNSSILTCNPCPSGCASCDQFTPTNCLSCIDGYQLSSQSCSLVNCAIANCMYCSSASVCQRCNQYYYWDGSVCQSGASLACPSGANGPLPNNCINSCSSYSYLSGNISNTFSCKSYSYVYVYPVEYYQKYYYAYNHLIQINGLTGGGMSLVVGSNGESGVSWGGALQWTLLPNYYRAVIGIKYVAAGEVLMTLTATTPSTSQSQTMTLSASSSAIATTLTTSVVHSYNLAITPNTSLTLIQLTLRLSRCSSGCMVCLNQQFCQYCDSPNYMLSYSCVSNCSAYVHFDGNMTCLTSCPTNYYQITTNGSKYCTGCVSPCQSCTNASFCLSCVSGYYYYNFSCPTSCPSGYYADNSTNTCKTCISPCRTCTSSTTCLSCSQGFWNGSQCASSCADGEFADSTNKVCSACSSQCLTCINSASTCTSCNASLLFYKSQCLVACPSRFYAVNGSCSECQPPCYTCTNSTFCLTCSYNYLLSGACQSTCPTTYYQDIAALTCTACQSQCKTCTSSHSCTSCLSGCLYSGSCPTSCPSDSFFPLTSNSSCACQQCIYPCSTCSSSSFCLSCVDGYLFNGSCSATCQTGYFANTTSGLCQTCSSGFSNCVNCTSTRCTVCATNYYLLSGSCLSSCPTYYYTALQQCILCNAPCQTCTDASICLSCVSPYVLSGSRCLLQCTTGQLALTISNISQCVSCTSPCLSCSVTQTNCTYCLYGYYLYNYQCLSNCSTVTPINRYYSQASTLSCQSCSFPCLTCLSESECLSCSVGYYNPSTYTCTQCSLGTYPLNQTCTNCPASCSACYSDTYCSGCNSGYYLYLNSCTNNTALCYSNGYYVSGSVCYACLQPCSTCHTTATNCTSCLSGYIFFGTNQCLIQCPSGYYRSNSSCLACSSECATCVTSASYCLTCASNYYLLVSSSGCVTNCPSGTFLTGSACSLCQYPCNTCTSETVCLSCITGVLIGPSCYSSCLSGYYASNNTCLQCTSPCSQCSVTATNCTQCITNYWLLSGTCISSCPATYFAQSQSTQCLQCVGLCQQCSSYINCTACSSSLIYFVSSSTNLGECLSSCPATYYQNNNTCLACMNTCLTCADSSSCLTCSGTLVQLSGQCISACPAGMYSLSGVCNSCSFPCDNCTDAYTCTSCPTDYLLVGGSSCMIGPLCPSGYYLLTNSTRCDSVCPSNQYNLVNGTCSSISCGGSHFMGADMFCYSTCPSGYIANRTYHCQACTTCNGLTFSLTYSIIKDNLYLYLSFTEAPEYVFTPPQLTLSPAVPYESINFPQQMIGGTNFTGSTNLTFLLKPTASLTATDLTVTFQNQLATFNNPLQKKDSTIYVDGYDKYPDGLTDLSMLGMLALLVAMIGLAKNPYMVDFAQTLFLVGLVNFHYPYHMASFLQSTSIAHLHGLISIAQPDSLGQGKFMYLTGVGFLSNTLTNLLLIVIVLGVSALIYLIFAIIRKRLNYSKVQDQSQQERSAEEIKQQQPCLLSSLTAFFEHYKLRVFNRIIYFSYSIISLFALVQIANFNTSAPINALSSALSLVIILLLMYYPLHLRTLKPKYTFLYIRKLLISGAVVLSIKDAIYAIGVISVCNLTAAILLFTYKMEKYRVETKFLAGCEIAQLLVQGCLSFFIMIGEGYSTDSKVLLCWVIVIFIVLLLLAYVVEASMQLVCYICLKREKDLKENWILNGQEEQQSSHHSESINGSMKDNKTEKQEQPAQVNKESLGINLDEEKFQNMLAQMQEEIKDKIQEQLAQESRMRQNLSCSPDKKGVFWAYSQSQIDEKQNKVPEQQPPRMLVRCVNQFSQVDPAEQEQKPEKRQ